MLSSAFGFAETIAEKGNSFPMPIESLYLLPVIALAIFFYVVAYVAQKESDRKKDRARNALAQQVESFNNGTDSGKLAQDTKFVEERFNEVEVGVSRITNALNSQQREFEKMRSGAIDYAREIQVLQSHLHKVSRDYNFALSENQDLRARMRKLMDNLSSNGQKILREFHIHEVDAGTPTYTTNQGAHRAPEPVDIMKKLYDDTRVYKMPKVTAGSGLDDTSEIDLTELN